MAFAGIDGLCFSVQAVLFGVEERALEEVINDAFVEAGREGRRGVSRHAFTAL
jgi:hypothetical protein